MSVYVEYTCMEPFLNVILTCDICRKVTTNQRSYRTRDHVVHLNDGRTICKPCFAELATVAEGAD